MTAEAISSSAVPAPSIWRSAAATIGTRAIDIPSRYGFHLLIAWKLGLVDAGAFYVVFSVLTLAAGLGRLGIDRAMTREVARALALGHDAQAQAAIRHGMTLITLLSLGAGLLLALIAPVLATSLFDSPRLTTPLIAAAIAIVPLSISGGAAGALAGLHKVSASQMVYSWLWPALFCLLAVAVPLTLNLALLLIIAATALGALASLVLLVRHRPVARKDRRQMAPPLFKLGLSLFTTEIVQLLMAALPGLVLGIFAGAAAVGAYAMAWRLALILNLLVVSVAAMASPRFAHCAARTDGVGLRHTAAYSLGLVLALGVLPLIILAIGAPWWLALFGEGFATGATELRLLLLGQAALMLAATAPELLGMTGHERAMQLVNVAATVIYAPVLVVLSYFAGGTGAALANLVASLVASSGALWLVRRLLGFTPPGALLQLMRARLAVSRA
ncbi:oligosaccharide flippase family protein [Novosphingobium sp. RD2P27]|uniref:Oligosaccharide flippase family protein n=1 Tax=Novosphingobium kalidii TaxID=3230299 RepID=A0ABV2D1M7_9SPHN